MAPDVTHPAYHVETPRSHRVQELFDRLADASDDDRKRVLNSLDEGAEDVRRAVESLLSGDGHVNSRLGPLDRPFGSEPTPVQFGRFKIGARIGGGGMGDVYEASDGRLDRRVAVKILHRGIAHDPIAKARFEREARAASRLRHRNICAIHEFGETDDGELFLVMPLYRGETLRERIARGPIQVDEILSIALQISQGLKEAHSRDIVHRDIKPGNILLTDDGEVVVLDFGLAMMADLSHITRDGSTMGTVAYMSPEQVGGGEVDARSDLWSLGVVMYEMLTGVAPFRGDHDQALIYSILHYTPPSPSSIRDDVPDALDAVVMRLLATDASQRAPDALGTIERLVEEIGSPALVEIQRRHRVITRRKKGLRILAIGGLILASVLAARWLWSLGTVDAAADSRSVTGRFVVLPFDVHGDEALNYLGQGIVPLLTGRLDGMGVLTAVPIVDVSSAVGDPASSADPGFVRAVLRQSDADIAVVGDIVSEGSNLSVVARVHTRDNVLTETVTGAQSEAWQSEALDILAIRIAGDILQHSGDSEAAVAAHSTTSLAALRSYLAGRRARREHRPSAAIDLQLDAASHDSTLAFAWYELSRSIGEFAGSHELDVGPEMNRRIGSLQISGLRGGRTASGWTLDLGMVGDHARRAANRHSNGLPERYRLKLEAMNASAADALRIYRILATAYPDDVETWLELGALKVSVEGRLEEGRRDVERAAQMDPADPRPLAWLMTTAATTRDAAAVDTLLPELVRRGWYPGDARGIGDHLLLSLLEATPEEQEHLVTKLPDANFLDLFWMAETLSSIGRCDLAVRVAAVLENLTDWHSEYGTAFMARCLAARGRLSGAVTTILTSIDYLRGDNLQAMAAMVSLFPYALDSTVTRSLYTALREWDPTTRPIRWGAAFAGHAEEHRTFLLSMVALRDGVMPDAKFVAKLDSTSSPEKHIRNILLAYSAAARGNTTEARRHLRQSPSHPGYPYAAWLRADIEMKSGQYDAALRLYTSILINGITYLSDWLDSIMLLRIAECHERLGNPEKAKEYYSRFLMYWVDAEPPYQHLARRATQRLELLMRADS